MWLCAWAMIALESVARKTSNGASRCRMVPLRKMNRALLREVMQTRPRCPIPLVVVVGERGPQASPIRTCKPKSKQLGACPSPLLAASISTQRRHLLHVFGELTSRFCRTFSAREPLRRTRCVPRVDHHQIQLDVSAYDDEKARGRLPQPQRPVEVVGGATMVV